MPADKIEYSARARHEVDEIDLYWLLNRPKNPFLFEQEMMEAEEHLLRAPEGVKVHSRKGGLLLRRYVLTGTRHHIYYHYEASTKTVHIVSVRGAIKKSDSELDDDDEPDRTT